MWDNLIRNVHGSILGTGSDNTEDAALVIRLAPPSICSPGNCTVISSSGHLNY